MEFTIKIYVEFLKCLKEAESLTLTFSEFIENPLSKSIELRHDVDKLPENSLRFAKIQKTNNIRASYYFRMVPVSYNKKIILEIASLGHEIGYHYETMDTCNGNVDKAYDEFCYNLETFRKLVPVKSICMHGSPRSPYDNRDIWKKYNYHDLGIIGEPYFDINFNEVAYYTDTGRMWDGYKYSVRDRIPNSQLHNPENFLTPFPKFHSTSEIISALNKNSFPEKAMLTFHPQRWTDNPILWTKELITQGSKNIVKKWFFVNHSAINPSTKYE